MGPFDRVNAEAIGAAVVDGGEDGHLAILFGEGRRGVGAPQLIRSIRHDAALMRIGRARIWPSARREQLVFAHYTEHPILPGANALMPEPGPDLPITLTVKDALVQNLANLPRQFLIG